MSEALSILNEDDLVDVVSASDDTTKKTQFTIGDLAKEFGCTLRTLRFYEDKGLLNPKRDGLNRIYNRRDRARLKLVLMGKRVGFSLSEIREIIDMEEALRAAPAAVARRVTAITVIRRHYEPIVGAAGGGAELSLFCRRSPIARIRHGRRDRRAAPRWNGPSTRRFFIGEALSS